MSEVCFSTVLKDHVLFSSHFCASRVTSGHAFWLAVFETMQNIAGKRQKLSFWANLSPLFDKSTCILWW